MPRGGRQKGSMNRDRRALMEIVQERTPGFNPVASMAEIASDESVDLPLRITAYKECAKYLMPQLKAVEVTGADGGGIELNVNTGIHRDDGS